MEKTISQILKWKGYIPSDDNPQKLTNYSYRITTTDGGVYATYRMENEDELIVGQKYRMKETGQMEFSFHNEPKKIYTKVRIFEPVECIPTDNTNYQTLAETLSQPMQMVQTDNMVEYHKLAVDLLWKMDELNLPNLAKIAPLMKDICEGKISDNKLGKLHLEMYGKMV